MTRIERSRPQREAAPTELPDPLQSRVSLTGLLSPEGRLQDKPAVQTAERKATRTQSICVPERIPPSPQTQWSLQVRGGEGSSVQTRPAGLASALRLLEVVEAPTQSQCFPQNRQLCCTSPGHPSSGGGGAGGEGLGGVHLKIVFLPQSFKKL